MARFKIPLLFGNLMEIVGVVFAVYLILVAGQVENAILSLLLYVVSSACLVFFPHGLSHYAVGRLVGFRFRYYYLGRSAIRKMKLPLVSNVASRAPILTLKIDDRRLSSVGPRGRVATFAVGAVASMLLPFVSAVASLGRLPVEFSVILFLICVANLVFDMYYSPKAGDIARARATAGKS